MERNRAELISRSPTSGFQIKFPPAPYLNGKSARLSFLPGQLERKQLHKSSTRTCLECRTQTDRQTETETEDKRGSGRLTCSHCKRAYKSSACTFLGSSSRIFLSSTMLSRTSPLSRFITASLSCFFFACVDIHTDECTDL